MFNSDDHISVRMCFIIFILFIMLLSDFLAVSVRGLQPFLGTDIDYGASPVDLQGLVQLEVQFVNELVPFCKAVGVNIKHEDAIQRYCKNFESSMLADVGLDLNQFHGLVSRGIFHASEFGYDAAKHPLKAYKIIKRFLKIFPEIEAKDFKNNCEFTQIDTKGEVIKRHSSKRKSFPLEKDLKTSALNILRLNQLFQLDFKDFMTGQVGKLSTKCRLSIEDLIHLGKVALSSVLPSQAVDIFDLVSNHPDLQEKDRIEEIEKLLDKSIDLHDSKLINGLSVDDIQYDSGPLLFSEPLGNKSTSSFGRRKRVDVKTLLEGVPEDNPQVQIIPLAYKFAELCTTEQNEQNPKEDRKLKCFQSWKSHPFFLVNPLKVEVHNLSPLIVQYYDVVGEREMTQLKDEVSGEMRMSRIMRSPEDEIGVGAVSRQRTSSNAWAKDFEHPKFHELLLKIGRILNVTTGKVCSTENMQIAAYSPGGHYVPHTDAVFEKELLDKLDPSEFLRGDRIITFMIYLSDVEAGGATAFPAIRKVIRPKKGSAVMWFNLYGDGRIRRDTFHGGCSVVYGVKWIANKWIRSLDQMFNLKCPRKEGDSLQLEF